jgi:DNA relaxase NicK
MVDIQGARLKLLPGHKRVEWLRLLLGAGLSPTRIDGALDFVGQGVMLHQHATKSCIDRELCLLRTWGPDDKYTAHGVPKRLHLRLGDRESAVCARIYDKGLEQGCALPGHWERLEVEWKEDRAGQVATTLVSAGDRWPDVLASLIFGALDFRERNGRSELARRPQVKWWADLVQGQETIGVRPEEVDKSFEKWRDWLRVAAGPRILELAEAVGEPVGKLCERLLEGVEPGQKAGPILAGFIASQHNNAGSG